MPSDSSEEDGPAYLCKVDLEGAECIAWDAASGEPMLVRNRFGKGYVYTLTLNAYPGHEKFQRFSAAWTEYLCREAMGDTYVDDPTGDIFWTVWEDDNGEKTLMLLNTDWTSHGNEKYVTLVSPDCSETVAVREREALIYRVGEKHEMSRVTL